MLLVFGLHTTTRLLATLVGDCRRCGQRGPHEIVESGRKLSVFFLPLFRVGAARYVDICGVCGWETELSEAQARSAPVEPRPTSPQDAPSWGPQDRPLTPRDAQR
jgi:zinc-ribbon family